MKTVVCVEHAILNTSVILICLTHFGNKFVKATEILDYFFDRTCSVCFNSNINTENKHHELYN